MEEDIVLENHSMDEFLEKDDLKGFVNFCFKEEGLEAFVPRLYQKLDSNGMAHFINDLFHELNQENFDLFESKWHTNMENLCPQFIAETHQIYSSLD